jgi:hypothetical protein
VGQRRRTTRWIMGHEGCGLFRVVSHTLLAQGRR